MKTATPAMITSAFSAYRDARSSFEVLVARSRTPLPEKPASRLIALRALRRRLQDTLSRVNTAWELGVALEESLLRHIDLRLPGPAKNFIPGHSLSRSRADLLAMHDEIRGELDSLGADSRLGARHVDNLKTLARALRTLRETIDAQKARRRTLDLLHENHPVAFRHDKTRAGDLAQPWRRSHATLRAAVFKHPPVAIAVARHLKLAA